MKGIDIFKQVKESSDVSEVDAIKTAFLKNYEVDGVIDYEKLGSDLAKCIIDPINGLTNIAVTIPSLITAICSVKKVSETAKNPTVSILLGALKGAEIPEKFGMFISSFLGK